VRHAVMAGFLLVLGVGVLVSGQVESLDSSIANASSGRRLGVGLIAITEQGISIGGRYWSNPEYGMELAGQYENWTSRRDGKEIHHVFAMLGGLCRVSDSQLVDFYVVARVLVDSYSSREAPDAGLCVMGGIEWSGRYMPELAFCVEYGISRGYSRYFTTVTFAVHYYFQTATTEAEE